MSIVSKKPIQHWLDTPKGSYYGYPSYGNSLHELLFENNQHAQHKLGIIVDSIERDLGELFAQSIKHISLRVDEDDNGTSYIIIIANDSISIGEYKNV